jgi:hypothetical protein
VSDGVHLSRRAALRILSTATVVAIGSRPPLLWARQAPAGHGAPAISEDSIGRRRRAALRRGIGLYVGAFAAIALAVVGWVIFMTVRHRRATLVKKHAPSREDSPAAPRPLPRQRRRR